MASYQFERTRGTMLTIVAGRFLWTEVIPSAANFFAPFLADIFKVAFPARDLAPPSLFETEDAVAKRAFAAARDFELRRSARDPFAMSAGCGLRLAV